MVSTARTGAGVKRSAGACLRNLRVRGDLLQRILDCFKTSKWILSIIFVTGQHLQPYMTECLYCQINWYLDHNVRKYTYDYGFTWTIAFLFHQVLLALWVHDRWLCLLNKLGSAYPCCSNGGLNGLGRCGVCIYIYMHAYVLSPAGPRGIQSGWIINIPSNILLVGCQKNGSDFWGSKCWRARARLWQ